MTDNPWAEQGRERKALAIEHALRGAGVDTADTLQRYVLDDSRLRKIAELAAADDLGHTWRKPASDDTWARVLALFQQTDESRALIPTTTED